MALHARAREARQVRIGDVDRVGDPLGNAAEAGAQDDRDQRLRRRGAAADDRGRISGRRGSPAKVDRPERHGQQGAQGRGLAQPLRPAEMHRRLGLAELGQALTAAAARRAQIVAAADHRDLGDHPLAGGNHGADRTGLGALGLREGGVLDVAACVDAAAAAPRIAAPTAKPE